MLAAAIEVVPIDISAASVEITGATTMTLTGVAAFDGNYWADLEWNEDSNKFEVARYDSIPTPDPMVLVPAGTFIMGDGVAWCGTDQREVTLTHAFWLARYEVTNGEYLSMVQWAYDQGHVTATPFAVNDAIGSGEMLLELDASRTEIVFDPVTETFALQESAYALTYAYPLGYDPSDHPVKLVTWYGAAAYCDWLSMSEGLDPAYDHSTWNCGPGGNPYEAEGYRLPTDAEWEYAAQSDDERIYPWGDEAPDCTRANSNYAWPDGFCVQWTAPGGSYPDGAQPNLSSPVYDLVGNVMEWCNRLLARISHQLSAVTAHLRTLAALPPVSLCATCNQHASARNGAKHRQGTNLSRLATKVGEKCGLLGVRSGVVAGDRSSRSARQPHARSARRQLGLRPPGLACLRPLVGARGHHRFLQRFPSGQVGFSLTI